MPQTLYGTEGRTRMRQLVLRAKSAHHWHNKAAKDVAQAWEQLLETPAPLWQARVLTLVDAHDTAKSTAIEWDTSANDLLGYDYAYTEADEEVMDWKKFAPMEDIDTLGWQVGRPSDYQGAPLTSDGGVRGPAWWKAEKQARRHLALLAMSNDLTSPGVEAGGIPSPGGEPLRSH